MKKETFKFFLLVAGFPISLGVAIVSFIISFFIKQPFTFLAYGFWGFSGLCFIAYLMLT